jgi:hypothetical protein
MPLAPKVFPDSLHRLIIELQLADSTLKTDPNVGGTVLRELRQALDNLRMTAWTVSELQNARDTRRDTRATASFLTGERVRRIRRMVDDFSADLERDGTMCPASTINELEASVRALRKRLCG